MNEKVIDAFKGEYRFLSNFWPCEVRFNNEVYPSIEHAYQAAKTLNMAEREEIRLAPTAGKAKGLGKKVIVRSDWGNIKLAVMEDLIHQKFSNDPLKSQLLNTGDVELIEGNTWGDTFWGVCDGVGKNHLGELLMAKRNMLRVVEVINTCTLFGNISS